MNNGQFFLGIILVFIIGELFLRQTVHIPSPLIDNNSFIVKKRNFDQKLVSDHILILGSSFFARAIDCSQTKKLLCFNLSLDGGDANSYAVTFDRFLKKTKPRAIVLEVSQMVFSKEDFSKPAIDGFIKTPQEHLAFYPKRGLTPDFKQSLKNQIDSYLLWSGLNFYSRRNRLVEWPLLIERKFFNHENKNKTFDTKNMVSSYNTPDQKKIVEFEMIIDHFNANKVPVFVFAVPDFYQGEIDNPDLVQSEVYRNLLSLEKLGKIHFVYDLTHKGLPKDAIADELGHLRPEDSNKLIEIIEKEVSK
jgi:hypothetical protein